MSSIAILAVADRCLRAWCVHVRVQLRQRARRSSMVLEDEVARRSSMVLEDEVARLREELRVTKLRQQDSLTSMWDGQEVGCS